MRKMIFAAAALCASPAAAAEDIKPLTEALFHNMAISYYCRSEIGTAHYGAARTIAKDMLTKYVGQNDAVLYVDEMDRKFRNDPRAQSPRVNAAQCFEMKSDAMHRIDVERAKLTK